MINEIGEKDIRDILHKKNVPTKKVNRIIKEIKVKAMQQNIDKKDVFLQMYYYLKYNILELQQEEIVNS